MQLAENGTLLDYVREKKFLDEPQARKLFKQLISAVNYIHNKGVVHRLEILVIPLNGLIPTELFSGTLSVRICFWMTTTISS